jgi:hypothetical protein
VKKTTHQWPNQSEHYSLVTDIAELKRLQSAVMSSAARNFKSEHARPYDGVAKSVVESCFRSLQVEWGTLIPGYVRRESEKRDGPENQRDAVPRLEDSEQ